MSDLKFLLKRTSAPVSTDDLLSDLRRVAALTGQNSLSNRVYTALGTYNPVTAARRFGTWNRAAVAAGLEVTNEYRISDERLYRNLAHLWEHYGRQPRYTELARPPSRYSSRPYLRRFRTWSGALEQFAAYANAQGSRAPSPPGIVANGLTSRNPSLSLRFRVLQRDNFSCRACGASPALIPGLTLHVDHIQPWSHGGETIEQNLQTLCAPCNRGKGSAR